MACIKHYNTIANEAARYERSGNYLLAAKLWSKASTVARKDVNRYYAEHREIACYKAQALRTNQEQSNDQTTY